jgi:mannose-6-phosphate isomerase-like protein (cupin superfamily)
MGQLRLGAAGSTSSTVPRMSGYTLHSLLDVDDVAAGRAPGLEARMARSVMNSEHLGVSYFRLDPGVRAPYGHHHRVQEEIYVVVWGSGRFKLDARRAVIHPTLSAGQPG